MGIEESVNGTKKEADEIHKKVITAAKKRVERLENRKKMVGDIAEYNRLLKEYVKWVMVRLSFYLSLTRAYAHSLLLAIFSLFSLLFLSRLSKKKGRGGESSETPFPASQRLSKSTWCGVFKDLYDFSLSLSPPSLSPSLSLSHTLSLPVVNVFRTE